MGLVTSAWIRFVNCMTKRRRRNVTDGRRRFAGERFEAQPRPPARRSPTGCSARRARPTTPCRRRGSGSAAPTRASVENLGGWLTTVVARVCLDMLRSRKSRREEPLSAHVPDPIVSRDAGIDPEHEAVLADSVGLALLVVLETLTPAERLAFVLHDMFGVSFDEIAPIVGRSPDAARQLASRAPPACAGRGRGPRRRSRRPARGRRRVPRRRARRRLRRARRGARSRRRAARRRRRRCVRRHRHSSAAPRPSRAAGAHVREARRRSYDRRS